MLWSVFRSVLCLAPLLLHLHVTCKDFTSSTVASTSLTDATTSFTDKTTSPETASTSTVQSNSSTTDATAATSDPLTSSTSIDVTLVSSYSSTANTMSSGMGSLFSPSSDVSTSLDASSSSTLTTVTTSTTTTTRKPTTTSTPFPMDGLRCGQGHYLTMGMNTKMEVLAPQVVKFSCLEGFEDDGTGGSTLTCSGSSWRPDPLNCVPVEPDYKPEKSKDAPVWIPVLVVLMLVVIVTGLVCLFILTIYACRGMHTTTATIVIHEQAPQKTSATSSATPKKERRVSKGWWPWQLSASKVPAGHIGLDGVAWNRADVNVLLPVSRR